MKNKFRFFGSTEKKREVTRVVEQTHGCNGEIHVDNFDVVYYKAGEVIYAKPLRQKVIGPCDGSCGNITATIDDGTGFLYP
ncbi:MAG TPA: hypothetical protein VHF05_02525 [Candidatus Paceibacterota bacterium]|jgi:hypothetical protein|nr:hypothetical protein [Candidatus Paceibacterota bacterium]